MLTFRGQWRAGVYYHAGDVAARGPWSYEVLPGASHIAGTQSEPGSGSEWARYWRQSEGVVVPSQQQRTEPAQALTVVQFPTPPAAAPVVVQTPPVMPAPLPGAASSSGAPQHAQAPAASEIMDDSSEGAMSVAFALDAIRQRLTGLVRREDLAAALQKLSQRLDRLEQGTQLVDAPEPIDPVLTEAWRRKCELLQAPTIAAARAQIDGMTRDMLRLLRKRDKGGAFTPLEASRIAILDVLDQHLADIDARAAELALTTPPDITADRHWPTLGAMA